MKTILQVLLFCAFTVSFAQINKNAPWFTQVSQNQRIENLKFQEIVDQANAYFDSIDKDAKGSGYKPFKRWESYWSHFVSEDGYLPTNTELWNNWLAIQSNGQTRDVQIDESNWTSLGPTDFLNRPTSTANIGRLNIIVQDPNNANTFYAGAPAGGIWKSTDAGLTWTPLIDHLPQIGVSAIAIDYNDSNTIYIGTGDDDASDSFTIGIWKSTDGGTTWAETGINAANSPGEITDVYIHPTDSNILWASTSDGVMKTTDAGASWTNVRSGNFRDLKVKPGDPTTLYAATSDRFFKSINSGDSFVPVFSGLPTNSGRMVIDVTPANPNYVYLVSADAGNGYQGVYRSTNSGDFFLQMDNTTDIFESNQAWYDLALAVSDTNADEIYVGVLNVWKSSNGGDSFTKLNNWFTHDAAYTHADIHFLRFFNNELYVGSDGGFFKSNNGGTTFTDYTEGMEISQFYRIDVSTVTANKIVGGTQDNGGFGYFNQWNNYHGGDGMEGVIDPNNDNLYYGFMQNGQTLFVSNDSGQSGSNGVAGPENGNWITPLAINTDSELFAGYRRLYQFTGTGWNPVSPNFLGNIDHLEIDTVNPDNMYVAVNANLYKSTNRGISFSLVEAFPSNITSIEVNNNNSDIVYVTISGFSSDIYRSTDGGNNFGTITGTLPDVVKFVIKHRQDDVLNTLYLGTHAGVYFYNDTTADWEEFNNNLPNVAVRDLAINLPNEVLIAGTYGRGIWSSPLAPTQLASDDVRLVNINNPISQEFTCGDFTPQINVKNNGLNTINSIDINYTIDAGAPQVMVWNGTLNSEEIIDIDLPTLDLARGQHSVNITLTIPNDAFLANNSSEVTFYLNDNGVAQEVNTFENPDQELIAINSDNSTPLWEMGVPTGFVLNSTQSGTQVFGTNLDGEYPNETIAYLYSQCYNLSAIVDPVLRMHMAFEIEEDWDLFYVQYSLDQGVNWNLLGSSSDPNWYNSDRIAGDGVADDCFNCVGGQWTGTNATMQEYSYNLAPFTNESSIIFRMVFHTDQAVTEEGVIIDNFLIDGTLSTSDFELDNILIYPNPSNNIFNIKMTQQNSGFDYIVSDLSGKVIMQRNGIQETQHKLDMSGYSAGIYFLNINTQNGSTTKKLILK